MKLLMFGGKIRPKTYIIASLLIFFSQHAFTAAVVKRFGGHIALDLWFLLLPLRTLATQAPSNEPAQISGLFGFLIVSWLLASLAFCRAADADISEWIAAAAIAPIFQVFVIALLGALPSRAGEPTAAAVPATPSSSRNAIIIGILACVGVTIAAVAMSTLLFTSYGVGLFIVTPFAIGAITGFASNMKGDIGSSITTQIIAIATGLGAVGLVAVALEGIICIVLLAPLAFGIAVVGGKMGRAIALSGRRGPGQAAASLALLPLVFALEWALPPSMHFDTQQSIVVEAPADAVWQALLRMDTIEEPPALAFRLGVAHPIRGEVIGEGVGATRRGEFSTGIAIERVTEWEPNRKLAFTVIEDVPAMRELSPYHHVHAPHAVGYFRTSLTSFELRPHVSGTEIVERTEHQLRLEPVLYWLPMTRWIVDQNNARILAQIKRQAERSVSSGR